MKNRIYFCFSVFSFFLLSAILALHFQIRWLPLAFLLLGFLTRIIFRSGFLEAFSFLIPIFPAFAALECKGFPLNYLLLPLFFLCGLMVGELMNAKGSASQLLPELPRFYFTFLLLLGTSFLFVMLRWSNLTLSPLAFLKDTPVAPTGQRLSFGIIFPVVNLALFVLSPLYFLLLRRSADMRRILIAFLCGQSFSILFSLCQRVQGWISPGFSPRGLASDATAFGFLSALAILLAWYLYYRFGAKRLGSFFAFIALAGILNSTTRVGFLAGVLAVFLFFFSERKKVLTLALAAFFLATILLSYFLSPEPFSSSLATRLGVNIHDVGEAIQADKEGRAYFGVSLTAHRNVLWGYAWECLREFPLTGVGVGNFVFWVMSAHRGDYFHHLTANQYLFFTSSMGFPGLMVFLLFCFALFSGKTWPEKSLLAAFLIFFLFNDYLWFPEIMLAFWLIASLGEKKQNNPPAMNATIRALFLGGMLAFAFFYFLRFPDLHPKNWAQVNSVAYDYGFYYPEYEKNEQFQWTGEKAGIYIKLDEHGRNENYFLKCGAPLSRLESKKQTVNIYWRGKFYKRVVFRNCEEYPIRIEDRRHSEGFLEFRVRPVFNLKQMELGGETRTLGVQLFGADIPAIKVVSPNGGENWLPGSIRDILWQSRGNIASVKIEMSYDGGRNYTTIGGPIVNMGLYSWPVVNGPSMNCLARVSGASGAASDVSDLPFAIASPPSKSGFSFEAPQKWTTAAFGSDGWYVGDFNGDGRSDLMRYLSGPARNEVFLSNGTRFMGGRDWLDGDNGADGWYVGDFNGDGRSDLMRYLPGPARSEVFLSNGTRFTGGSDWFAGDNGADGWYIGDFNGDGRSDIMRCFPELARNEVFLSDGTCFVDGSNWLIGDSGADGWYVGDFNGDGCSDLMRLVPGESGAEVLLSDGARFVHAKSWTGASPGGDGWYVGDFNGDKKCDIMRYAEWMAGSDVLLAGNGCFIHDGNWSGAGRGDADWYIGDFNGNGSSDLMRHVVYEEGENGDDVLLATAERKPGPLQGEQDDRHWLADTPLEDRLLDGREEKEFFKDVKKRIRGGKNISIYEIQKEYEKMMKRKCRRVMVLRLIKHHGLYE